MHASPQALQLQHSSLRLISIINVDCIVFEHGCHIAKQWLKPIQLSFPVFYLYALDVFEILDIGSHHHHLIGYSCAAYQQIEIVVSWSSFQLKPYLFFCELVYSCTDGNNQLRYRYLCQEDTFS